MSILKGKLSIISATAKSLTCAIKAGLNRLSTALSTPTTTYRAWKCRHDVHDYPDHIDPTFGPCHFYTYTCRHCGRKFVI